MYCLMFVSVEFRDICLGKVPPFQPPQSQVLGKRAEGWTTSSTNGSTNGSTGSTCSTCSARSFGWKCMGSWRPDLASARAGLKIFEESFCFFLEYVFCLNCWLRVWVSTTVPTLHLSLQAWSLRALVSLRAFVVTWVAAVHITAGVPSKWAIGHRGLKKQWPSSVNATVWLFDSWTPLARGHLFDCQAALGNWACDPVFTRRNARGISGVRDRKMPGVWQKRDGLQLSSTQHGA